MKKTTNQNVKRTGIIIYTKNYDELISFYKKVFDINHLFEEKEDNFSLMCFDIGGMYIMIETLEENLIPAASNSLKLRFNVENVNEFSQRLNSLGIKHKYQKFNWGEVVDFQDVDGNYIGVRDEVGFIEQIK